MLFHRISFSKLRLLSVRYFKRELKIFPHCLCRLNDFLLVWKDDKYEARWLVQGKNCLRDFYFFSIEKELEEVLKLQNSIFDQSVKSGNRK